MQRFEIVVVTHMGMTRTTFGARISFLLNILA